MKDEEARINQYWWNITSKLTFEQLSEYLDNSTNYAVKKEIFKCFNKRFWKRWYGIDE